MARSKATTTWLVGDIGGTNARFGLVATDGTLLDSRVLADADYPGIGEAIDAYLSQRGGLPRPRRGAIAIASAIVGDEVRMTNHPWTFSIAGLRQRLRFQRLLVINDFTAQALALPRLGDGDKVAVGGGKAAVPLFAPFSRGCFLAPPWPPLRCRGGSFFFFFFPFFFVRSDNLLFNSGGTPPGGEFGVVDLSCLRCDPAHL